MRSRLPAMLAVSITLVAWAGADAAGRAADAPKKKVLVELYTSQG